MLGKTHIVNSVAIAAIPLTINIIDTQYTIILFLVAIGSLIPDIDEPNSIIGRKLKFLSYPINIFFGHRTITHNLILFTALAIFFYTKEYTYLLALNIGILLHILQDSITYQGIKNGLFPIRRLGYNFVLFPRAFRFAVGSITEHIIFMFSVIFILFIIYKQIVLI